MSNSFRILAAVIATLAMVLSTTAVPLTDPPASASAEGGHSALSTTQIGDAGARAGRADQGADRASARAAGTASVIYAILCPGMFKEALGPLKEWKTKKGMNAEIYTLEEMKAAYGGSADDRDFIKVHQYLRRLWQNNSELKWVLVVGDGDTDGETFPVPYIFTNASHDEVMGDNTILDNVPSDVMYSGLEHSWDTNNNGLFGEPGEADWTPEVYVGRWPSKTVTEVADNVNKVLTYERTPTVGDWMKSALFAGALYDIPNNVAADPNGWTNGYYEWPHDNGRTVMLQCGDPSVIPDTMIKTYLFDYDQQYGGSYSPANDGLSRSSFTAEFNAGNSIVTTASHAWISGNGPTNYMGNGAEPPGTAPSVNFAAFFDWADASAASNGGALPLMYSSACDVANFTTTWYEYVGDNHDHTLEQLLKNPGGGAIGFISATNGDYWSPTDGNWWLEVNFWKIFFDGSFRPGEALYKDKVAYDQYLKSIGKNNELYRIRQNKAVYVLLGDPEVPVWTDLPRLLSVEAPTRLINARQTVNVTVRDAGNTQPVKNAMVAFTGPGTFARGFTDAGGVARVTVEPASLARVNITVTAHNFFPSEQDAEVVLAPPDMAVGPGDLRIASAGPVVQAGEAVTISAVVSNIGGLEADNVPVNFYDGNPAVNGSKIGTFTIPKLPAHQNATAQMTWTAVVGPKAIYVWVDPANIVSELDEGNNIASIAVIISAIDLAVSPPDITVEPSVLRDGVQTAASDSVLNISATVHNLGSAAAQPVYVSFYDGDPRGNASTPIEGNKRIDFINPGSTGNATVSWNRTSGGQTHQIFAVVNPVTLMNHIVEYDDSNNEANISVRLDAPPVFNGPLPAVATNEDVAKNALLDLTSYVSDPDNDVSELVFRIISSTESGANVTVTPEGLLSIRPLPDWNGVSAVTVGVSDGISEISFSFSATVRPENDPPVMDDMPEANLTVGQTFVYNVTVRDPDLDEGDQLVFTTDTDLFAINRSSGKIIYAPVGAHVGKHTVKVTVTDSGGLSASTFWKFTVVKLNAPPKLQIGENQSILGMETKPLHYKFNATHSDPDAPVFSVDTGMFTINAATGEINFTPPKGTAGTYKFNVTVRDLGGLSDTRMVTLVIAKLPSTGGNGSDNWGAILILLMIVVVICVATAGVMVMRIRGRGGAKSPSGSEKERYEALYGAGTYEYARKGNSSSLREFRNAEKRKQSAAPAKCPKCGSSKVQVFPDGGAICNKCGETFK